MVGVLNVNIDIHSTTIAANFAIPKVYYESRMCLQLRCDMKNNEWIHVDYVSINCFLCGYKLNNRCVPTFNLLLAHKLYRTSLVYQYYNLYMWDY